MAGVHSKAFIGSSPPVLAPTGNILTARKDLDGGKSISVVKEVMTLEGEMIEICDAQRNARVQEWRQYEVGVSKSRNYVH